MKRRKIEPQYDFELLFTPHGSVQLKDMHTSKVIWTSDNDEDFAEEFEGDFFDGEDAEEILEYLDEEDLICFDEDIIDIVEEDLNDEEDDECDDDNVIEAEFHPSRKRGKKK